MKIRTGQTVYEDILSLDADNNPVSGATFDVLILKNGINYSGVTISMFLSDGTRGIFSASWSSGTIGDFQIYAKNNSTGVVFISNTISVYPDSEFDQNIFIGL